MKANHLLPACIIMGLLAQTSQALADIPVAPGQSIQAALDIASATPGPDVIVVSAGTYNERLVIEDADPVQLKGTGEVILVGPDPEEAALGVFGGQVTVSQMTITGGDDGIQAVGCEALTLSNLIIINTGDEGVDAEDCAEVFMMHCRIIGSADHGFQLEADPERVAGTVTIMNCEFIDNDGDGIKADDLASVVVNSSICTGNSDGLDMDGNARILLRGIVANDNRDEGLEVDGAQTVEVNQGLFGGNEGEGMDIDDAVQIALAAVTCVGNEGSGLQVKAEEVDAREVIIINGRFEANEGNGIELLEDEASIQAVDLIAIHAQDNELSGLYLDISGALDRYQVISRDNGLPDIIP